MKSAVATVLLAILIIVLIIGCANAIKSIFTPRPVEIGPHDGAFVEIGDYVTTQDEGILISGYNFFTLQDQATKEEIYPTFIAPKQGEESFRFETNPPKGKYRVSLYPISVFSESPTSIVVQGSSFSNWLKSFFVVFVAFMLLILGVYIILRIFI